MEHHQTFVGTLTKINIHKTWATQTINMNRAHSSLPNYLQKSLAKSIRFHCLQPIFSSSPPWTFSKPEINLQLMELSKKTTSPITYRERFQSLNICYTDGSKTNNRTGPAYSINNSLYSKRHRNFASVFTTELQAIYLTLQHILSHPPLLLQLTLKSLKNQCSSKKFSRLNLELRFWILDFIFWPFVGAFVCLLLNSQVKLDVDEMVRKKFSSKSRQ